MPAWELDAVQADLAAMHERLRGLGLTGTAFHLEVALRHLEQERVIA